MPTLVVGLAKVVLHEAAPRARLIEKDPELSRVIQQVDAADLDPVDGQAGTLSEWYSQHWLNAEGMR